MNDTNNINQQITEQSHYQLKKCELGLRSNQRPGESKSIYRGNQSDRIYRRNNANISKLWGKI